MNYLSALGITLPSGATNIENNFDRVTDLNVIIDIVLYFGRFSSDLCGRYDHLLLHNYRRSAPPCEEGGEDVISRLLFRRNHSPVREERFCSLSGRENCRRLAGGPAGEREQMEKMDRNRSDSARGDFCHLPSGEIKRFKQKGTNKTPPFCTKKYNVYTITPHFSLLTISLNLKKLSFRFPARH